MAATTVLKKIVVWIAVLLEKDTENARFGSNGNDLTFPCERLSYYVRVRSYKVHNLQQRGRNLVFLINFAAE